MAIIKFLCEFFFTNFWHWIGGLFYLSVLAGAAIIKFSDTKKEGTKS